MDSNLEFYSKIMSKLGDSCTLQLCSHIGIYGPFVCSIKNALLSNQFYICSFSFDFIYLFMRQPWTMRKHQKINLTHSDLEPRSVTSNQNEEKLIIWYKILTEKATLLNLSTKYSSAFLLYK